MNRISFADLTGKNRIYAIYWMLLHTSSRRGPGGHWKKSRDIEKDLREGYNPDQDFAFYLDQKGQLSIQLLLSIGELPAGVEIVRK